jgi:hypothetical protein
MPRWEQRVIIGMLVFFGLLFVLVGGALEFVDNANLDRRGVRAEATVTAKTGGRTRYIDVRFRGPSGALVNAETDRFIEPVEVGDRITILYDRSDPETIRHVRYRHGDEMAAVSVALGAPFLLVAAYIWRRGVPRWWLRRHA